jgi:hypothetical protein
MNLLDPNEFVSAILPDGLWSNDSGAEDSEECLVCILCKVDFDKDVNLDECLHWIPGWFSKDLPHAQELSNQWLSDFEDLENKELVDLNEKKDYALEEVVANALEFDIARCERRLSNYKDMVQTMQADHGIICHDTCKDGNCAVDMLWHLLKPPDQKAMEHVDVRECTTLRADLRVCWESAVESPVEDCFFSLLRRPCGA